MNEKIRVALCITELQVGGAEKAITELARTLTHDRFEPVVYSLRSRDFHRGAASFIPTLEESGVPVRFLDISGAGNFLTAIGRLANMLHEQKADVFQSFMFHANLLGRLAAHRADVPVVCSGLRVSEKERKKHLFFDRLTARWVDSWVCVSRSVADFSEKVGKLPKNRLVVIPNAFGSPPIQDAAPMNKSLFEGISGKKAVVVGRLVRQKGIDWLLQTAQKWASYESCETWGIWIIGNGVLENALKKQATALGPKTAERIHFAGWRPDVPKILADCDLLLLPSRWEGMPNAVLEAMAAGRAVLATRSDGVLELLGQELSENQTCDFGNSALWCEKMAALMRDDGLRRRLGKENQERVRQHFSVEKTTAAYERLWTELLEKKRRSSSQY